MNCKMPKSLVKMFKGLDEDNETRKLVAVTIVYDQCKELIKGGIKDFHFILLIGQICLCNLSYFRYQNIK